MIDLPDGYVRVRLVPIEIFGQQCEHPAHRGDPVPFGYGLCDAVAPWSDCNRADGRMFRLDDCEVRAPADYIEIIVSRDELWKFDHDFRDSREDPPTIVYRTEQP